MVEIESSSSERIEKLLSELPKFGILPVKASSIEEVSPGKWKIYLSIASFLREREMNFIIEFLMRGR